jgi:hypothetical protein
MSKERTNPAQPTVTDEREFNLRDFLEGKIDVTRLLTEESEGHSTLRDAVLALAQRNIQQSKA